MSLLKTLIRKDIKARLLKAGAAIGNNVDIFGGYFDYKYAYLLEIGDNVTITHSTILLHDASIKKFLGYAKLGRVSIGNNCFIGYGSIVLPGVSIGNDVIVGAGTVVRSDIPDGCVVVGNPMQIICKTEEYLHHHRELLQSTRLIMPLDAKPEEDIRKFYLDPK